jgi:hypothetical protein
VREHPRRRAYLLLGALVAAVLLLVSGYLLRELVGPPRAIAIQSSGGAGRLQEEVQQLRRELALSESRHDLDQSAMELLRGQLAGQQQELADLQLALQFYRQLMAPESVLQGVAVRQIELVDTAKPNQFRYRILIQQEASQHSDVEGSLQVVLIGLSSGIEQELLLSAIDAELAGGPMLLRFKYFQAIEGFIDLPEEFAPDRFRMTLQVVQPRASEIEQQFPWRVRPRFSHVGQ